MTWVRPVALVLPLIPALLSSACSPRVLPNVEHRLESGWGEVEDQDFESARGTFLEVLESGGLDSSLEAQALYGFAVASSESGELDAAVEAYERLVRAFPDQTDLVPYALFNSAGDYERLGRFDEAEAALMQMLEMAADDSAPSGDTRLMGNPYANQRHYAAFALAEFYARRERYVLAEAYLAAARHAFPYQHFCGNALRSETYRSVLLEATILEHLGETDRAEAVLLPYVFELGMDPCLEQQLAVRAATLIRQELTPDELAKFIQNSLDSIRSTDDPGGPSWTMRLDGHEVSFDRSSLRGIDSEDGSSVGDLRQQVLRTSFFRVLTGSEREELPSSIAGSACWPRPGSTMD
jgi:hypothetical protein